MVEKQSISLVKKEHWESSPYIFLGLIKIQIIYQEIVGINIMIFN